MDGGVGGRRSIRQCPFLRGALLIVLMGVGALDRLLTFPS